MGARRRCLSLVERNEKGQKPGDQLVLGVEEDQRFRGQKWKSDIQVRVRRVGTEKDGKPIRGPCQAWG